MKYVQTERSTNQHLIQQVQADIANLSQTYTINHKALQEVLSDHEQHIQYLEAQRSDQAFQQVQTDIANLRQTYANNYSALQEVLSGQEHHIKRLEAQRSDQALQKVQANMANLNQAYTNNYSALQEVLSGQGHHIKRLEAQRSEQARQVAGIAAQLGTLSHQDNKIKPLEALPQDINQLKVHIEAIEFNIRREMHINQKRMARTYQFLVVVSAIAAAGLAIWGQGYFNQNNPQPAPTTPAQVSMLTSQHS